MGDRFDLVAFFDMPLHGAVQLSKDFIEERYSSHDALAMREHVVA